MKTTTLVLASAVVLAHALFACDGSDSSSTTSGGGAGGGAAASCNDDPFACAPGTTCWIAADMGARFECFPSGEGQLGEVCETVLAEPRCGDGLFCMRVDPASTQGVCTAWCSATDPAHACPEGAMCLMGQTPAGLTVNICDPSGYIGQGGGGGQGGSGGQGGG